MAEKNINSEKKTALFSYDLEKCQVLSLLGDVKDRLKIKFIALATDQPSYWPDEEIWLKIAVPLHQLLEVKVCVARKGAAAIDIGSFRLDDAGVGVIKAMDGSKKPVEAGEYIISVENKGLAIYETTSFSVVEGHLGAVSFAYDFEQYTSAEDLKKADGGWFLGNASGIGDRFGNGLNIKNELRVLNQPFNGRAVLKARCHLPGCSGCEAGPAVELNVTGGVLHSVLNISSHSGPFELEVVTKYGSVSNFFAKSGHVERQSSQVSSGMGGNFYASVAAYENTVRVSGRDIYIEARADAKDDPLLLKSVIADDERRIYIEAKKELVNARLFLFTPDDCGNFNAFEVKLNALVEPGEKIAVECSMPYTFIACGGFLNGEKEKKYFESWAIAFASAGFSLDLSLPGSGAPLSIQKAKIKVFDNNGFPKSVSGILEVFDNRVEPKNIKDRLDSAVGDSFRALSNHIAGWRDWIGIQKEEVFCMTEMSGRFLAPGEKKIKSAPRQLMPAAPGGSYAAGASAYSGETSCSLNLSRNEKSPEIRLGEKKVVYCAMVKTGPDGTAEADFTLPPQTGRCQVRFTAFDKFDYRETVSSIDCSKKSYIEASLPVFLMPDSKLVIRALIVNNGGEKIKLKAYGASFKKEIVFNAEKNSDEFEFSLSGENCGKNFLELSDDLGNILDLREFDTFSARSAGIKFSEIIISGSAEIKVEKNRNVVIYLNPARLCDNIVSNIDSVIRSWFPDAEALCAEAAIRAILIRAMADGIIRSDGVRDAIAEGLKKALKDFREKYYNDNTGLVRPYPDMPENVIWTALACVSFGSLVNAMSDNADPVYEFKDIYEDCVNFFKKMSGELIRRGISIDETALYSISEMRDVAPVEVNGNTVYAPADGESAVEFFKKNIVSLIGGENSKKGAGFAEMLDTYRFLKTFERIGPLYYLLLNLKALLRSGDKSFFETFNIVSKRIVNIDDPGLIQGPAMLGGVYCNAPQTFVKYMELLIEMAKCGKIKKSVIADVSMGGRKTSVELQDDPYIFATCGEEAFINVPEFCAIRVERIEEMDVSAFLSEKPFFKYAFNNASFKTGEEGELQIILDDNLDSSCYYAIVMAPSNFVIRQTDEILSDYKGGILHGQKSSGGVKMQFLTAPFRGSKKLSIRLECLYAGESEGIILVRHAANPQNISGVKTKKIFSSK